jgi:predicted lipid-binding transport protein (Tim44 family)
MKYWSLVFLSVFLGAGIVAEDVQARRLGGARSMGAQRHVTAPPASSGAASNQAAQKQAVSPGKSAATTAPARSGMSRWLGPIVGLAAGLGLAALFGEQMGSIILLLLIAAGVALLVRMLMRGMTPRPQTRAAQANMQYGMHSYGEETVAAPPPSQNVVLGSGAVRPDLGAQFVASIPADFDVEAFVKQAKHAFITLQAANDRGDLEALRELVSDELFESLKQDIDGRVGAVAQQTDVVTLDAQLLEVVTESGTHWASIRFSGMLREEGSGTPSHFEEIWNLQKPEKGNSGWTLAGIQQFA